MRKICLIGFAILLTSLTSCAVLTGKHGYFPNHMQRYTKARRVPPLRFPKNAEPQGIQDHYPVPTPNPNQKHHPVNALPPDLLAS